MVSRRCRKREFLAQGRGDIQHAVKEPSRGTETPTEHVQGFKRMGRYLLSRTRYVVALQGPGNCPQLHTQVDRLCLMFENEKVDQWRDNQIG